MSREELNAKTRKELRVMATKLQITGRWEMNKEQLIEAILGANNAKNSNQEKEANENLQSAKEEVKIDNLECKSVEAEIKIENKSANVKINREQKLSYIENINIGTIIAFHLSNGKVKSAKVMKKSTKNRKLKVETDYGAEYIISYDDVIWVRTGKRWPRGVYELLKGKVDANGKEKIKA